MSTPEKSPDYDARRGRGGANNEIHQLSQRARWWQRGATILSLGLGALTVTLQENDAAAFIPLPVVAAVAIAAGGANIQKRTREKVDSAAEGYIRSIDPLSGLEPTPPRDLDTWAGPWHGYVPVYSVAASACGTGGAYLLPFELINDVDPVNGVYSPGRFMIAGSVLAHIATERSIGAHEQDVMRQMDAAESRAA